MEPKQDPIRTTFSILPVTALQTLRLPRELLVLSGQGCFLTVLDSESTRPLLRTRVFESTAIHGIVCTETLKADEASPTGQHHVVSSTLFLWAATAVCFIRLLFDLSPRSQKLHHVRVFVKPKIDIQDWVLNACFTCTGLSAVQRVCLITTHSTLLVLQDTSTTPDFKIPRLLNTSAPLLYSAKVKPLPFDSVLIVTGTAFGEVFVCSTNLSVSLSLEARPTIVRHVFTGHQGSIFGVDISDVWSSDQGDRWWISSCSDDRTVRLGFVEAGTNSSSQACGDSAADDPFQCVPVKAVLFQAWSHASRVWGVKFLNTGSPKQIDRYAPEQAVLDSPYLLSTGEDVTCRIWQTGSDPQHVQSDKYHSGKNIWSISYGQLLENQQQIFTGGADGCIIARTVFMTSGAEDGRNPNLRPSSHILQDATLAQASLDSMSDTSKPYRVPFAELLTAAEVSQCLDSDQHTRATAIKQYNFVSHCLLLAVTNSGHLLRNYLKLDAHGHPTKSSASSAWNYVPSKSWPPGPLGPRPVLSTTSENGMACLGNADGDLFVCFAPKDELHFLGRQKMQISWLCTAGTRKSANGPAGSYELYVVLCPDRNKSIAEMIQITIQVNGNPIKTSSWSLELPESFVPTCARMMPNTAVLVLGSRKGAVAVYTGQSYTFAICIRHVHGPEGLTSINIIQSSKESQQGMHDLILTTGRDGTYGTHITSSAEREGSEDKAVSFETIDMSMSQSGVGVEGAYCLDPGTTQNGAFANTPGRLCSGDLILYGFRSTKFVVWNETRQSQVSEMECAGSHRSWAYNTYETAALRAPIVHAGLFAWTQARAFNLETIREPIHSILQHGGHGREIKALSISPRKYHDAHHGIRNSRLVATGAEDTTIRLFTLSPQHPSPEEAKPPNEDSMHCVKILNKHTTGLQHLAFSRCGNYLLSSGGYEELFAWRITYGVPIVGLGVVLDCAFPKETPDSDLRITDFDIATHGTGFTVSAVYSNSLLKSFQYMPGTKHRKSTCTLLRRTSYRTNCLTQINISNPAMTVSASTDGHLAFWPAGLTTVPAADEPPVQSSRHRVHQNSIKTMLTVPIPSDPPAVLTITGGDDNAIALTLTQIQTQTQIHISPAPSSTTLILPTAHAAAVTALCILDTTTTTTTTTHSTSSKVQIRFLSVSNDQHVKLWSVSIRLDDLFHRHSNSLPPDRRVDGMAAVTIARQADVETCVADAGGMEVVPPTGSHDEEEGRRAATAVAGGTKFRVLVVGVGMEVLEFDL